MDRYRSHKVVEAFKIVAIEEGDQQETTHLIGEENRILVSHAYMDKHKPQVDGYYVRYPDGYESWSPAEAFEDGYTKQP